MIAAGERERSLAPGLALALALMPGDLGATPELDSPGRLAGVEVYSDDARPGLFYYGPGELKAAADEDGRPLARLLQVRYVGTRAAGDQGESLAHGLLTLTVRMDGHSAEALAAAAADLAGDGRKIELRPLPIARLASSLVYAPVEGDSEAAAVAQGGRRLGEGHFEETHAGVAGAGSYWRERTYSLRLGPLDAQVLWDALHADRAVLSLGYVFFARGRAGETAPPVLSGHPDLVAAVQEAVDAPQAADLDTRLVPVKSGAMVFRLDLEQWPELAARHDLNERLPPGYPLLDVYCYDFREDLSEGLEVKRVDLRAESPADETVELTLEFDRNHPDLYARSVRFPFAVRLDRPYRYRVIEIRADGSMQRGEWIERDSWSRILDVTRIREAESPAAPMEEQDAASLHG
jgi:hypothetical protein